MRVIIFKCSLATFKPFDNATCSNFCWIFPASYVGGNYYTSRSAFGHTLMLELTSFPG